MWDEPFHYSLNLKVGLINFPMGAVNIEHKLLPDLFFVSLTLLLRKLANAAGRSFGSSGFRVPKAHFSLP